MFVVIRTATYKTQAIDTSIEAERLQFELWRSLPLWEKAELVSSWTKGCWEMCLNAILHRYPNASSRKIKKAFALLTLEKEIAEWIFKQDFEYSLMLSDPISLALVVTDILNSLEIPYLVGGSVASTLLGEPRSTQDIDLVVDLSSEKVELLIQALQPRFHVSEDAVREAIRYQQSFNIIDNQSLGKVDIFILKDQPFNQIEFQRRQPRVVRENPEQVLVLPTPEDIIIQKLIWYQTSYGSEKQWRDILGVIKLQGEKLDFDYLQHWANELKLIELLHRVLTESEC